MKELLIKAGLKKGQHVLVHSSFRNIKSEFPSVSIEDLILLLQEIITPDGSLIMPAFTYNWKPLIGIAEVYDRERSASRTGAVTEVFRRSKDVVRTSSPTHSFSLWGKVNEFISYSNSPDSPLGAGSVCDWLAKINNRYILMLGTDFSSMSFCHYLEIRCKVPWYNYSPWSFLNIAEAGLSLNGEQKLKEIPGCSKSFIVFEEHLLNRDIIHPVYKNSLRIIRVPVHTLLNAGWTYFREHYLTLLCQGGTCKACDKRREFYYKKRQK